MLKDYRQDNGNRQEDFSIRLEKTSGVKDYRVIDEAWDLFSEYIGEQRLKTPLSILQFEMIFDKVAKDEKFRELKSDVLESFRYDSYSWPLVERDDRKTKD